MIAIRSRINAHLDRTKPFMKSIFKPALCLMSGRALGFAATFLIPVILVRMFDQAGFGTYKQLFLIYFTLFGLAQLGMAESLYYFLPVSPRESGHYVVNTVLVLALSGLVCAGLLAVAGPAINRWMNNGELSRYIPWLALHLWLMLASEALERVMISRKQYLLASFSYGFSDLLRAGFFTIPVLLLRQLEWLLICAVIFSALRLCAMLLYLWREFAGTLRPDLRLLSQQLAYALPFTLAVMVETVQANFPQYAVSYYFDAATFAIYAVGCLQIPFVDFIASPVANVMMVGMTEEVRDGRGSAVVAMWHATTRKLALVFFPLVGLLLVNAREIILLLFTDMYLASVPIFMIWSTVLTLSALQTDAVLRVYAQTRSIFALNVARLLMIAVFIHWFLSAMQLVGAVLITVLASAVGKGLGLAKIKALWQIRLEDLLPWRSLGAIAGAATASGMAALLIKSVVELSTLSLLATTSLVYAAMYVVLAVWFPLFNEEERLAFTDWLPSWTARPVKTEEL